MRRVTVHQLVDVVDMKHAATQLPYNELCSVPIPGTVLQSTLHINVPDEVTNLTVMIRKVCVWRPCCHLGAKN